MFDLRSFHGAAAGGDHDQTGDCRDICPTAEQEWLLRSHSPQRGEPELKSKLEPGIFSDAVCHPACAFAIEFNTRPG
jgi:hypothetical protein